jgi:formylglycine-generating enzyme required for sulfatase activity
MNSLFEIPCPKCRKSNLIDNGDTTDQTVIDVQEFKCWNCGSAFRLGETEDDPELIELFGADAEAAWEGARMPSEKNYEQLAEWLIIYSKLKPEAKKKAEQQAEIAKSKKATKAEIAAALAALRSTFSIRGKKS